MHIAFRVDSSITMGHGHVMRCLTLAQALERAKNPIKIAISFITKTHQGNINHLISTAGYQLILLATGDSLIKQEDSNTWLGCTPEQDARQTIAAIRTLASIDLLIVDHYAIAKSWHQLVKPFYQQLMVIDDLASRSLDCDILLDQTLNRHAEQYQPLVPEHCQLLLGQNYMLLRDEFAALRAQAKDRRKQMIEQQSNLQDKQLSQANILITMGGGDPDNLSALALLAVEKLRADLPNISATIVLSSQSKHLEHLLLQQQNLPWCQLIIDSKNMAQLMLNADIAIGASGVTAWERCCLGLPSLTTVNAENQQLIAANLANAGASINLGWHQKITIESIAKQLRDLLNSPQQYMSMVSDCFAACDGLGTTNIAEKLLKVPN